MGQQFTSREKGNVGIANTTRSVISVVIVYIEQIYSKLLTEFSASINLHGNTACKWIKDKRRVKMRAPKQVILDALRCELGAAEDNFARAKMQSQVMSKDEEYGQSGQTLRQILGEYLERKEEVKNALRWANTL